MPLGEKIKILRTRKKLSLQEVADAVGASKAHIWELETGKQVFAPIVQIDESPHVRKGLASSAFDEEGVATQARALVKDGVVQGYFLGSYAARKLGTLNQHDAQWPRMRQTQQVYRECSAAEPRADDEDGGVGCARF